MAQAAACLSIPALCAADLNTTVNHEPRIMDLRLAEALGFGRLYDIRKLIRRHIDTLRTFGEVCATWRKPSGKGGRPSQTYWLSKRQALFITAKSDTERAAHVTVRMVEVFDEVTSGAPGAVSGRRRQYPAYPRPVSKATLITYATWLWGERVRVLEQIYPDVPPGHRTGVAVNNPGYFYHHPREDEVAPAPSTRAEMVLRLVGGPIPEPRPLG